MPSFVVLSAMALNQLSLLRLVSLLTIAAGSTFALGISDLKKSLGWRRVAHTGWLALLISFTSA